MRAALSPFHQGPCWPIWLPGGSGNPPGIPVKSRFHPEHFRCPNIGFQYINLYVSTISRLLVMSVITSETPNNLRYIKMHKLIITVIATLSVRTLRFENNVDMTETRLRSITNSGTWMPILAPTYSTKIFIGQTAQQHTLFPLSSVCYLPEIRSSVSNT